MVKDKDIIQLLGKVVFELLPHILQKLKMERTFLHAWCIDTLHQLGQLNPFKIEQETFIRLHFQRHDDFEGLHLQFHLAPVAEFGVFHPNQSGQKYHGGDHQQEACAHQRIDNPSVHSFEIQLQWKKHSAHVLKSSFYAIHTQKLKHMLRIRNDDYLTPCYR